MGKSYVKHTRGDMTDIVFNSSIIRSKKQDLLLYKKKLYAKKTKANVFKTIDPVVLELLPVSDDPATGFVYAKEDYYLAERELVRNYLRLQRKKYDRSFYERFIDLYNDPTRTTSLVHLRFLLMEQGYKVSLSKVYAHERFFTSLVF